MKIGGLQKLTLLDYPGEVACTVFTSGCNLACPFCHNAALVNQTANEISAEDVLSFLKKRKGILKGVAITGGEPLWYSDTEDFIKRVQDLGFKVKLDTNGTFTDRLESILKQKLVDYVAMDVKNSAGLYAKTTGCPNESGAFIYSLASRSMAMIRDMAPAYEFRTTVVKELHTKESLIDLAQGLDPKDSYYLQAFKDSGDILNGSFSSYDVSELKEILSAVQKVHSKTQLRGVD